MEYSIPVQPGRASEIEGFVRRLASVETGPGCANFFDHTVPANALRRRNLAIYLQEMLERAPKVLLVGEAPGFRGMKITGVPFTSRTILEGPPNGFGLFGPGKGYVLPPESRGVAAEPTATVMWTVLAELDFLPLLWSACPWHTHVPGQPLSNRTPTASEAALGSPFWQELAEMFAIETVVAVGNVAHRNLHRNGVDAPKIRHPAHGGRSGFKRGLGELIAAGGPPWPALGWKDVDSRMKGSGMNDPNEPTDPAGMRGPGDPDAVEARQPHPEAGRAGNIREEQLTQGAGTVPAAYVGSGDPDAEDKPEDAADAGGWDSET